MVYLVPVLVDAQCAEKHPREAHLAFLECLYEDASGRLRFAHLDTLFAERAEAEKRAAAEKAPAPKAARKTAAKTAPNADMEAAPKRGRKKKDEGQGNLGF